jgi:hypothetical protein
VYEICRFSIFNHDLKVGWVVTFRGKDFFNCFTRFKISMKFCVFWYAAWTFSTEQFKVYSKWISRCNFSISLKVKMTIIVHWIVFVLLTPEVKIISFFSFYSPLLTGLYPSLLNDWLLYSIYVTWQIKEWRSLQLIIHKRNFSGFSHTKHILSLVYLHIEQNPGPEKGLYNDSQKKRLIIPCTYNRYFCLFTC